MRFKRKFRNVTEGTLFGIRRLRITMTSANRQTSSVTKRLTGRNHWNSLLLPREKVLKFDMLCVSSIKELSWLKAAPL